MKINKLALFTLLTLSILFPVLVAKASPVGDSIQKEIDSFNYSYVGNENTWKVLTPILENPSFVEIGKNGERGEDPSDWPLMFSFAYNYSRAEKKKMYDYVFPYNHPKWAMLRGKAEGLTKSVQNFVKNKENSINERKIIAIHFEMKVHLPMLDLLEVLDLPLNSFYEINYPSDLFASGEEWAREFDLIPTKSKNDNVILNKSPLSSLNRQMAIMFASPTSHFYYKLVKLLYLQSSLIQLGNYTQIIGDRSIQNLPYSCTNSQNGLLPSQLTINLLSKEKIQEQLDNILTYSGLLVGPTTPQNAEMLNAAIENSIDSFDPNAGGLGGVLPFETFVAYKKIKSDSNPNITHKPLIDSSEIFFSLIDSKLGPIIGSELNDKKNQLAQMGTSSNQKTTLELEVKQISEIFSSFSTQVPTGTPTVQVSKFIIDQLEKNNLELNDYEKLLTNEQLNFLKNNKMAINKLPAFESSWAFKRWVFFVMDSFVQRYLDDQNDVDVESRKAAYKLARLACIYMETPVASDICVDQSVDQIPGSADYNEEDILEKMEEKLSLFQFEGEQLTANAEHDQKFVDLYRYIQTYWELLMEDNRNNNRNHLQEASMSEADYIYANLTTQPLVQWRINYFLWNKTKNNYLPSVQQFVDKMFAGINMDKTISPLWAEQLLSSDEKIQFWEKKKQSMDADTAFLYNSPVAKNDSREFYDILLLIQNTNLMNKQKTYNLAKSIAKNIDSKEMFDSLENSYSSDKAEQIQLFMKAYESRGNIQAFKALLDSKFETKADIARAFYNVDVQLRSALNSHLLKESAFLQRERLLQTIDQICQLNPKLSTNQAQTFLAMTMTSQASLMQEHSIKMPESISEVAKTWTNQQWAYLWFGLGAGVLSVATVLTMGLSAPITAPIAFGLAATALTLNTVSVGNGIAIFAESEKNKELFTDFRAIGATTAEGKHIIDKGGLDGVILQTIFIIPNVNMLKVTTMVALNTMRAMNKGMFYGLEIQGQKRVFDEIKNQINLNLSKKAMGYYGTSASSQGLVSSEKVIAPFAGDVAASSAKVATEVGKIYSNSTKLFKGNYFDRMLVPFLKKMQRKLDRLERKIVKLEKRFPNQSISRMSKETFKQLSKTQRKYLIKMGKIRIKMNMHMAVVRDFKVLPELDKRLSIAVKNNVPLETFILENMDELSLIIPHLKNGAYDFMLLPTSKLFSVSRGAPIMGNSLVKVPGLGRFFDGPRIKRLFVARNAYAQEMARQLAAKELGLGDKLAVTTFDAYESFQLSLMRALEKASDDKALEMIARWEQAEDEIAQAVWQYLHADKNAAKTMGFLAKTIFLTGEAWKDLTLQTLKHQIMDVEHLKELIRSGDPLGKMALNSMKPSHIFGGSSFQGTAHQVALKMADFDNMDEFERYFAAVKLMFMNDYPSMINVLI